MSQQEVTALTVKNYKGVKGEITLAPEGKSLIVIAGPNGAGKSSFIDAIAEIFDPKGVRLTAKPIHDGAEEASAEVTTTEARLVRKWTKDDAGTLSAYALDGAKYASGKDFVVKATGGAIFDASEFINMDAKEQRATLLARVELPFDLATLDRERAGVFEQRRDIGRTVDQLTGQLAGMPEPLADTPDAEVSAASIVEEYEKARAHNTDIHAMVDLTAASQSAYERADDEVARLEKALANAVAEASAAHAVHNGNLATLKSLPELIDTDAITARLTSIESVNARVRAAKERQKVADTLAAKKQEHFHFETELKAIDKKKLDALAEAKFPVAGLSVDDDGVTFEGIPFKQVNTAKKTEIAFNLATSATPDLRLVVIKDGDSLDADSLAAIENVATERGYIVLVERDRDESREIGAVFIGGELSK